MEATQGERSTGREIEPLLVELQKGIRAVAFYPPRHPSLLKVVEQSFAPFSIAAHEQGEFSFSVTRAGIWLDDKLQSPENEHVRGLAKFLFQRRIKKLFFLDGLTLKEWYWFLRAISVDAEEMQTRGGLEKLLQEKHLTHVFVNNVDLQYLKRAGSAQELPAQPAEGTDGEAPEVPEPAPDEEEAPEEVTSFSEATELDTTGATAAAATSTESGITRTVDNLLTRLHASEDPDTYYSIVVELANLASELLQKRTWVHLFRIIEAFEKDSQHTDASVETRKYAIRGLRKIASPQVARALLTELGTDDKTETEVESLLRILTLFGNTALEALAERLKSPFNEYAGQLFIQLITRIGQPALPLVLGLADSNPSVPLATFAAQALGSLRQPESVPVLTRLVSRRDEAADAAIDALLEIRDLESLNVLGRYLSSDNPIHARKHIMDAAGNLKESRLTPILLDLFRRADDFELTPELRKSLNIALARIGGKAVSDGLIEVLKARKLFRPQYDRQTLVDALKILAASADQETADELRSGIRFRDSDLQEAVAQTASHIERRLAESVRQQGSGTP